MIGVYNGPEVPFNDKADTLSAPISIKMKIKKPNECIYIKM